MKPLVVLVFILGLLAGCSDSSTPSGFVDTSSADAFYAAQDARTQFLAYEHSFQLEVEKESLEKQFQTLQEACASDEEHLCTLLDSQISLGDYPHASATVRIAPEGVDWITKVATENAVLEEKRTYVEDLESEVLDVETRITMAKSTLEQLAQLETQAVNDVDSLIKIVSEMNRLQSELEKLQSTSEIQQLRIQKHLISFSYVVPRSSRFYQPLQNSIDQLGTTLSMGLGHFITALAYVIPWILLIWITSPLWRRVFRRRKS